jgi:PAS domain S-box-containing protein
MVNAEPASAPKLRTGDLPSEIVELIGGIAIIGLDANGIITSWNAGAQATFGYEPSQIIGKASDTIYLTSQRESNLPQIELQAALSAEGHRDFSGKQHRNGSVFMAETIAYPIRVEGTVIGFTITALNLDAQDAAQQALKDSETQLRLLIGSVAGHAIFRLDRSGRVASWNAGAQKIKGYSPEEIIGRDFSVFYTRDERECGKPQFALSMAARNGHYQERGLRVRKDGSLFKAEVEIYAICDAVGRVTGFEEVTRDMTEEEKRAEIEARNLSKSRFLAHLSHEFRTPLNAIIGFSDMIQNERLGKIDINRYVTYGDDINNCSRHLLELVVAILDLTRAEAGRLLPQYQPIELNPLIDGVIRMVAPKAADLGVALDFSITGDTQEFRADPRMLRQCLINLLDNAIKFSQSGGVVRVAIERSSGCLSVTVTDKGKGMREQDIPLAIEAFQQLGDVTTSPMEGVGLGLALVKSFCDLHSADFTVRTALGKGTEVTLAFPYPGGYLTGQPAPSTLGRRRHEVGSHQVIDQERPEADPTTR